MKFSIKPSGINATLIFTLLICYILFPQLSNGGEKYKTPVQFFVAPDGNDNNPGTPGAPLKTIEKAGTLVSPGDTILLRGGTYSPGAVVRINFSGTADKMISILAYKKEIPVLNCISTSEAGVFITGNYIYLKGLTVINAKVNGLLIYGSNNIIEQCTFYKNGNTGLHLDKGASNNRIINCDAYLNYDRIRHGEDADGFGAKFDVGPGNAFFGCRAYNNSDDGWDLWQTKYSVRIENCWAFSNGINLWADSAFTGDGNGIKLGGRENVAPHVMYRCLAFCNQFNGFDQNNNLAPQTVLNCTSFKNGGTNYRFEKTPLQGVHILKNNISHTGWKPGSAQPFVLYGRRVVPGENDINTGTEQVANSWNGFTMRDSDFMSIDSTGVRGPRKSDGSLPDLQFLKLKNGSPLIDAGKDIGYPYNGSAPDPGAYEFLKK